MSHTIRQLEERLGTRLLNRNTRSVALTDTGAALLRRIAPALTELHDALDQFPAASGVVAGPLRINAPPPAIELVLAPIAGLFLKEFPHVRLEVMGSRSSSTLSAPASTPACAGWRYLAQDMIAVPLGSRHADLEQYRPAAAGRARRRRLLGIIRWLCTDDLAKGRLVSVLDDWQAPFPGPFLYYPAGGRFRRRCRPSSISCASIAPSGANRPAKPHRQRSAAGCLRGSRRYPPG